MDEQMIERLRPALKLLPIECHDTPDYAEATGPQFQAMTMTPEAFLALNALPEVLAALEAHSVIAGKVAELTKQRLMILAAVYPEAPRFIATICDEKLDRSGKLLGEVRALARAALAPYPERRSE